jgi:hypothetical protein
VRVEPTRVRARTKNTKEKKRTSRVSRLERSTARYGASPAKRPTRTSGRVCWTARRRSRAPA